MSAPDAILSQDNPAHGGCSAVPCSRSFIALVDLLTAWNRYGDGASLMHPRLTMAITAARKTVDEIINERPERESETSVHDECARSPSYHGHTRCAKCNEVHWMHGDCKSSENAERTCADD
jgi:hypothetical protein